MVDIMGIVVRYLIIGIALLLILIGWQLGSTDKKLNNTDIPNNRSINHFFGRLV